MRYSAKREWFLRRTQKHRILVWLRKTSIGGYPMFLRILWWLRELFRGRRLSAPKNLQVIYDRKI